MLALSGLLQAAETEADVLWKKVDEVITAMHGLQENYATQEEYNEHYKQVLGSGDDASKAFLEKFPNDVRRWKIRLLDADYADLRKEIGLPPKCDKKAALDEILKSTDADPETKAEASCGYVNILRKDVEKGVGNADEWIKLAETHLKTYPDYNPMRNKFIKDRIANIKTIVNLKTKPIDLKFTAVDGREVDISKMTGKVVLIEFWATWCGPCIAALPKILKTYEKHHEKGFEVIGISVDEEKDKEKLVNFTKKRNMPWPQYFDGKGLANNDIYIRYGVKGVPTLFLVNKKGMVVNTDAPCDNLEAEVEKLLAE